MPKPATKCEFCDTGFEQRKGGRPARFCSEACRNRAHRKQKAPAPPSPKPSESPAPTPAPQKTKGQLDYLIQIRDRLLVAIDEAPVDKTHQLAKELRFTLKEIDALTPRVKSDATSRKERPRRSFDLAAI